MLIRKIFLISLLLLIGCAQLFGAQLPDSKSRTGLWSAMMMRDPGIAQRLNRAIDSQRSSQQRPPQPRLQAPLLSSARMDPGFARLLSQARDSQLSPQQRLAQARQSTVTPVRPSPSAAQARPQKSCFQDQGMRAVIAAVRTNDLAALRRALSESLFHDLDINSYDGQGDVPLLLAAKLGHTIVLMALLNHPKINVNVRDPFGSSNALMAAGDNLAVVTILLAQPGIDINLRCSFGHTALMDAAIHGYREVVQELLKHGARVDGTDTKGWTILDLVDKAHSQNKDVIIAMLKARGAK